MTYRSSIKYILIFIILFTSVGELLAQWEWGGRRKKSIWEDWSATGNVGMTSFFGDISLYDDDFGKKLNEESGLAFSVKGRKHINSALSAGGQILYGNLKGEKPDVHFESSMIEYNLFVSVNFINLIFPYNTSGFNFDGYVAVGQFLFNSTKYFVDNQETEINNTGVPEFVYLFGFEGTYLVTDRIGISASMAIRQAQNDQLDVLTRSGDYDYYTYVAIGATYYIKELFSSGGGKSYRGRFPMRRRR